MAVFFFVENVYIVIYYLLMKGPEILKAKIISKVLSSKEGLCSVITSMLSPRKEINNILTSSRPDE